MLQKMEAKILVAEPESGNHWKISCPYSSPLSLSW